MGYERALPLALGALAVSSGLALLTFDILLSISLSEHSPDSGLRVVAVVASGLEALAVGFTLFLLGRRIRYRNGSHIQDFGQGRKYTYWLAGLGGMFGIMAGATSATVLGFLRSRTLLPERLLGSSLRPLVDGGFVVWAAALISQAAFVICTVVVQRRNFQQETQPYRTTTEDNNEAGLQDSMELPTTPSIQRGKAYSEKTSAHVKTPRSSSSGRSRSGSDAMNSMGSSFSLPMRPATSKTKLISKSPYRGPSMESYHENNTSIEDGFDSWDTSTVDAQSRHAVESASPTPPRFLETIPASPAGSRSPSPGCPLDLQLPPKTRRRSRSLVAGSSHRDVLKTSGATSPENPRREGHIHPLFRTDSLTPPPSATPGTIVTAAPGAGLLISDRQSIRSLARMRSGSLPSSPLAHSSSLDSMRFAIEREEREREWEQLDHGIERTLTPPIPDFVLNGTPRSSPTSTPTGLGYAKRKTSSRGLGKVGEGNESER